MKKLIKKTEEVSEGRYIVLATKVDFRTGEKTKATEVVVKLQLKDEPLIILLDTKIKNSTQFKKTMHQKNYRIIQGDYNTDFPKEIQAVEELEGVEEIKE